MTIGEIILNKYRNIKISEVKDNPIEEVKSIGKYAEIVFPIVYALEYWGPNNNGDAFPYEELLKTYTTFLNGAVYLQHNIDDRIGDVINVYMDKQMKRVLVKVRVYLDKLPEEVLDKILQKRSIGSSMGCAAAYDVCSVCGHISYNWLDKCKHIKSELLSINKETGKLVYMINYSPSFFDVSIVALPGDLRAYSILQKLENENNYYHPLFNFEEPEVKTYRRNLNKKQINKILKQKEDIQTVNKISTDVFTFLNEETTTIPIEILNKYKDNPGDFLATCIGLGIKLNNKDLDILFSGKDIYIGDYKEEIANEINTFVKEC
jgi:hypothetical protein